MPRPRFSLATLFILLTAFGVWLGVQVKWIKDRREYRNRDPAPSWEIMRQSSWDHNPVTPSVPGMLWLLGERAETVLFVEPRDADLARRLFPEAEIRLAIVTPALPAE